MRARASRHLSVVVAFVCCFYAGFAGAGRIAVTEMSLTDNGDGDGFADTNETVRLQIRVRNTTGADLTAVTAYLSGTTPQSVCVTDGVAVVGDLAAEEEGLLADTFEFHVSGTSDRTALGLSATDLLTAGFRISFEADQGFYTAQPRDFAIDLDLDVSGGSGSGDFFETFEAGLGAFEMDNLDAGLGSNNTNSDDYRCQYNDPDWIGSNSYGSPFCYLGLPANQNDEIFWRVDDAGAPSGGRGFTGSSSLHFGIDLGGGLGWTTPLAVIDAVRLSSPVHLPWDLPAVLSFRHQASLMRYPGTNSPPETSVDRGIVMVQRSVGHGTPAGPWIKIHAFRNDYDTIVTSDRIGCAFDPVDDGSTEDDFFDPSDPARRLGPSSTCNPQYNFAAAGETASPFDPEATGVVEGPGLEGETGPGTWVESRFDLSRFRGSSIRLRFLVSSQRAGFDTWETQNGNPNPMPYDDGWWIDDVAIDSTLATAATVTVDTNDNSALPVPSGVDVDADGSPDICDNCATDPNTLQLDMDYDRLGDVCDLCPWEPGVLDDDSDFVCDTADNCQGVANTDQIDGDFDGHGAACDCNDGDGSVHPGAEEINDGLDQDCNGVEDEISGLAGFPVPGDDAMLAWPAQPGATDYQVVRGDAPDFSGTCDLFDTDVAAYSDPSSPPLGSLSYYLVRARKPLAGSWGTDSSGTERIVPCAP